MTKRKDAARFLQQRQQYIKETIHTEEREPSASFQERLEELARPAAVRKERLAAFLPSEDHSYSPRLTPVSRELVRRLHVPGELVEDRLLRQGQVKAAKQQVQAVPSPKFSPAEGLAVAERLLLYHQAYRQHRQLLIQKYTERFTWRPTISAFSRQVETRVRSRTPNQSNLQLSFKPKINLRSRALARKLSSSEERLRTPRKSTVQEPGPECTFHPSILPRTQSVPAFPRWELLYSLSMNKLERRARLRLEARQRAESVSHCTFRPSLFPSFARNPSLPVIDRLLSWGQQCQLKRKEAKEHLRKVSQDDCTFRPTVLPTQIYTSEDWRKTIEKSPLQPKKTYRYSRPVSVSVQKRETESPLPSEASSQERPSPTPPVQKDQHELTVLLQQLGEDLREL